MLTAVILVGIIIYIFNSAKSFAGAVLMLLMLIMFTAIGMIVGGFLGSSLVIIVYFIGLSFISTKTYQENTKEDFKITSRKYKLTGCLLLIGIAVFVCLIYWIVLKSL